MNLNRIKNLSFFWFVDLIKRPLTWILLFGFVYSFSNSIRLFSNEIDDVKTVYFLTLFVPSSMLILNVITTDYIFELSFKDGIFYYLISSPVKLSEIIISKLIVSVFLPFICMIFFIIFIFKNNPSYFFNINSLLLLLNSFVFYILLTIFILYIFLKGFRLSQYINRGLLLIILLFFLVVSIKTESFKNPTIFLKTYILTSVLNIFLLFTFFLIFKKVKRSKI